MMTLIFAKYSWSYYYEKKEETNKVCMEKRRYSCRAQEEAQGKAVEMDELHKELLALRQRGGYVAGS